jgi:hypothetical protein
MNGRFKKWYISLLIIVFVFGIFPNQGFADESPTEVFRDLNQGHNWALKHIAKMSNRGVIKGDPSGRFLPDQYVSQEQAIAMVVRAMGLESEVTKPNVLQGVPSYRSVSDWAKGYIAVAHTNELIQWDEEKRFQGKTAATRQWIAQLMIRMLEREEEAVTYSTLQSTFADKDKIESWAKGYVNLASSDQYGLITGFKNTDGSFSFRPDQYIRRIELATLLSRAEKHTTVQHGNEVKGSVLSFTGDEITIQTANGPKKVYTSSETLVFKDDKIVSLSTLDRFQPVLILGDPTVAYIEILDQPESLEVITGNIIKTDKTLKFIAVKLLEGDIKTYALSEQVKYNSKAGPLMLEDLLEGEMVEITIAHGEVTLVYRLSESNDTVNTGIVYDIDIIKNIITIQNQSGSPMVYSIFETAGVQYPDGKQSGINGLRKGMKVELQLENSTVTNVNVLTIVEEGVIKAVSSDGIITYKTNAGAIQAFQLTHNAMIKLKDGTVTNVANLRVEDQIVVEVESSGIVSIEVTNRLGKDLTDYSDLYIEGTVVALDQASKTLILSHEGNRLTSYKYDSTPELYINDVSRPTLDHIKQDMKAKIQLFNDKVTYIEVDNRIEGVVEHIDPVRNLMTLRLDNNERWVFKIDRDYDVSIRHMSYADIEDIERNDYVRLQVTENNIVTDIDVRRDIGYIVTDIYEYSKRLNVEDEEDDSFSLYITASVELNIPSQARPKIDHIKVNDIIKATFLGDDLKAITLLPSYRGKVTHVDTTKSEYTVVKYDGTTVTIPFQTGDVIKYRSYEYTQLSSLLVNDRVEISEWLGGKHRINKMEKVDATYKYKDNTYIYVNSEARSYKYVPDVFVREQEKGVTIDRLVRDNSISMFLLDGVIYEIHKK